MDNNEKFNADLTNTMKSIEKALLTAIDQIEKTYVKDINKNDNKKNYLRAGDYKPSPVKLKESVSKSVYHVYPEFSVENGKIVRNIKDDGRNFCVDIDIVFDDPNTTEKWTPDAYRKFILPVVNAWEDYIAKNVNDNAKDIKVIVFVGGLCFTFTWCDGIQSLVGYFPVENNFYYINAEGEFELYAKGPVSGDSKCGTPCDYKCDTCECGKTCSEPKVETVDEKDNDHCPNHYDENNSHCQKCMFKDRCIEDTEAAELKHKDNEEPADEEDESVPDGCPGKYDKNNPICCACALNDEEAPTDGEIAFSDAVKTLYDKYDGQMVDKEEEFMKYLAKKITDEEYEELHNGYGAVEGIAVKIEENMLPDTFYGILDDYGFGECGYCDGKLYMRF